ncbi:restriction endonuclease subunit S [Vreelandella aquamarina]|jgi:type I restriction enzyme S subunit|uniref:Restriction endonuclease n=1 Tax=Vreelandella aquamarina TaxID=77097 RepID=A0A6F8SYE5_9GAMM|nr:restriction endonuclease subunit S [Halomonas meridiana]MAC35301.1 restriction endonuclease subunit S [Haliea sp.]BCA92726.1 restriction endonuclease [Halomonas meridiana]|tara:strand:- start:4905 stop:6197 length:1293 start_codon:yes stop_codon:yes gene_type:complete
MVAEWQQIPLEDGMEALIDYRGKTPTKTQAGVPLITAKVVKNGRIETPNEFISHDDYDAWMRRGIPQAGDVLITTEAPLGEVAQLGSEKVALAQRLIALRGKNDVLDNTFLKFLLQSDSIQNQLRARASGSTVSGIKQSELRKINLLLPPLPEQRAIAHILGTLDNKIELNRRRNQTLEAMARALFKDWFVDFGPVRAKMRGREPYLPADLWNLFPDRLDDEGRPGGWETVPASELIEFNPSEPLRKGTPAPYLDMASLPTSGSWPEPPVTRNFGSGMRFRNGDTLLARITPCLENGKTAFVQCLPNDTIGWGSTEYIVMRPKSPVPAEYPYLLARDDAFREHAIRSMTGTSGRQRAQGDSVAAFKLASPPDKNVWHAFAKQVMPLFESIKSNAKANETLAQLRDSLLPKLISGELRIKDAEIFMAGANA